MDLEFLRQQYLSKICVLYLRQKKIEHNEKNIFADSLNFNSN